MSYGVPHVTRSESPCSPDCGRHVGARRSRAITSGSNALRKHDGATRRRIRRGTARPRLTIRRGYRPLNLRREQRNTTPRCSHRRRGRRASLHAASSTNEPASASAMRSAPCSTRWIATRSTRVVRSTRGGAPYARSAGASSCMSVSTHAGGATRATGGRRRLSATLSWVCVTRSGESRSAGPPSQREDRDCAHRLEETRPAPDRITPDEREAARSATDRITPWFDRRPIESITTLTRMSERAQSTTTRSWRRFQ